MNKTKELLETIRLYKKIFSDLKTKDKRDFSNENLQTQCKECDTINNTIDVIILIPLNIINIFLIFYGYYELFHENFLIPFIAFFIGLLISSFVLVFLKAFDSYMKKNAKKAKRQLTVNELLDLQDDEEHNVYVLKDSETLSKFCEIYDTNNDIYMIIVNYENNELILYFCYNNGKIKLIYPEDDINILIQQNTISVEEYIGTIQTY